MRPLLFYTHHEAFTPRKTELILILLQLPFELVELQWVTPGYRVIPPPDDTRFKSSNASGRVPFLYDPNADIGLGESNVIARYLIETYDTAKRLSYEEGAKRWEIEQWLDFQSSAQNVIFQQAYLLSRQQSNPEYLETLQEMMKRSISRLDTHLAGPNGQRARRWLTGDKCTVADLSFLHWDCTLNVCFRGDEECGEEGTRRSKWPHWTRWRNGIMDFSVGGLRVKDVLQKQLAEMGHPRTDEDDVEVR